MRNKNFLDDGNFVFSPAKNSANPPHPNSPNIQNSPNSEDLIWKENVLKTLEETKRKIMSENINENIEIFNNLDDTKNLDVSLSIANIGKHGVSLNDLSILNKLAGQNISASILAGLDGCHAKWVSETYVLKKYLKPPADNPAARGSLFHEIMENLLSLPREERTVNALHKIYDNTCAKQEYLPLVNSDGVKEWLQNTISGVYDLALFPQNIEVAKLNIDGKQKNGVELYVQSDLIGSPRKLHGFIDLVFTNMYNQSTLTEHHLSGKSVIIADWKTSKDAKPWNEKDKFDRGYNEARQQKIYALLLESRGIKVDGAKLFYPYPRKIVNVNINSPVLTERVLTDIATGEDLLDRLVDSNQFEYKPSALCSWCPLAKACPKFTPLHELYPNSKSKQKALSAIEEQPTLQEIKQGFNIIE